MRNRTTVLFSVLAFFAFNLIATSGQVHAQATASAALQGTVTDQSGASIADASITLTSKSQGWSRNVTTPDTGFYRFELLPPGEYSLKITRNGFATISAGNVTLPVGQTTTLDFSMKPGQISETVMVTTEAVAVDVEKTQVGLLITPSDVRDIPLNGRDFANLAYLAPGARPVGSYDPTKNRIAIFGINGSSGRNVNVTVNGIDNKDNTVGGPVMQLPLDAIQEFNISTQRFSAANGRSEGGAVNVVTKAGSNGYHGALYLFDTETSLNANDAFSKAGGQSTPQFSRQQFGGNVGGPLRHDKDFFFFALERQREHTSFPVTPAAFTELSLVSNLGAQPAQVIPTPYFDWRYTGRLDHRFNDKHNLFMTYNAQSNDGLNDQSRATNDLTGGNFTTNKLILSNLTLNSVFNPNLVNSLTAGYQYWNNLIDSSVLVPTITFPSNIYFGTNTNVPQESIQKKWQFKDDLSYNRGSHAFKTGFDYLWEPVLGGFFKFNPTLEIDFFDLPSKILSDRLTYPQGFATPGAVSGMSNTAGDPNFYMPGGAKMFGIYFQDDWKVRRNITLNLGVRWDKDYNLIGSSAQAASRTYLELKAIGSPYAASLPKDDSKNFSPRVGFAWDLKGNARHVIRAGFGIYFGQTFQNIPLFMIQQANATVFATTFSITGNGPGASCSGCTVPGTAIPLSAWRFGVDPMPTNPPPATQLPRGAVGRLMDPAYRNPYSEQWNAGYAWAINSVSTVEVEYIHGLGLHESKTININPLVNGVRPLSAAFAAAGVPVLGRVDDEQSIGRSRYDGLNVSYKRRMAKRFSLNTAYVLSKGVAYKGHAAAFRNRPVNPFDPLNPMDFGPVPNDERHRITLSSIVELPWGLTVAPVFQASSSRPYDGIQGRDVLGVGSGRGNYSLIVLNSDPTNLTATKNFSVSQLQTCLAAATCHTIGFNALRGDPFIQLDLRVTETLKFKDRMSVRLIGQFFNLTNRANYGNQFDGNVRSATFLQPIGFVTPGGVIVPHSLRAEFGAEFRF